MASKFLFLAALCLVISAHEALSQNINNFMTLFGGIMQQGMIQAAQSEWRKVPLNEIGCIEQGLAQQGTNVQGLIRRAVMPNDPGLGQLRANCRLQIVPQVAQPVVPQSPPTAAISLPAGGQFPTPDSDLSATPTFDCTTARSSTARILCLDHEGAKSDWDLTSTYWARSSSLIEADRDRLKQEHENWFPTLNRSCRLEPNQSTFSAVQRQCVLTAFRKRTELYRAQLKGDALSESRLGPQQHGDIQYALGVLGFLEGKVDGEFGPMTRTAIRTFQSQSGFPESDFLTAEQRDTLLRSAQLHRTQTPNRSPQPQPSSQPAPADIAKIKEARAFLDDTKTFMTDQTTVSNIVEIASEAARLQIALDKMDDAAALVSMNKLNNLMKPIKGFDIFLAEKRAERTREDARQLAEARTEGEKHVAFIDSYVKSHLGDRKTTPLLKLRQQLEDSVRKSATEEIVKANRVFQAYLNDNDLLSEYQRFALVFSNPPPSKPDTPKLLEERLGVGPKSHFLLEGPTDDIILIYNFTPSAPAVSKNLRGDIVFRGDAASLCFGQGNPDAVLVRYIERLLSRQGGATKVILVKDRCDLSKASSSIDIIAFQRGELLKQPETYVSALVRSVEDDNFREYRIVTDYNDERKKLEQFSLELENEVEKSAREGYGVLAASDAATVCVVIPQPAERVDGIKALLAREKDLIAPKLNVDWKFEDTTADLAYLGLQRQQCGYVAADATVLRAIVLALRSDHKTYRLSPVWFTPKEVAEKTFDVRDQRNQALLREKERARKIQEDREIEEQRRKDNDKQNAELERQWREKYGPRARSYREIIHRLVKDLAEGRSRKAEGVFSVYAGWLRGRFADQWETFEVTTDISDFGSARWKGRQLDAIIVKSIVQQKNRIKGEYSWDCFLFGLIEDSEFSMEREVFSVACENGDRVLKEWRVGNEFQSLWNAERTGEVPSRTRTGELQPTQPYIQDQQRFPLLPTQTEIKPVPLPAETADSELPALVASLPAVLALRRNDPTAFNRFKKRFTDSAVNAKDDEILGLARGALRSSIKRQLANSPGDTLLEITETYFAYMQGLEAINPESCVALSDESKGARLTSNLAKQFPVQFSRDMSVLERVASINPSTRVTPLNADQARPYLETVFNNIRQQPVKSGLLGRDKLNPAEFGPYCTLVIAFYRAVLALPRDDKINLLRYLYASADADTDIGGRPNTTKWAMMPPITLLDGRSTQGAMVAQKVVLSEEDQANPNGKQFDGSAVWRVDRVPSSPGQKSEVEVRADIVVPELKMSIRWSLRRNDDKQLPASHTNEIVFTLPADFPHGDISNIPGVLMKHGETTRGVPLNGAVVKVTTNFFLIGLSSVDADMRRNIQLLKERPWFDIPVVYGDGKRAIIAIEKGTTGERAFADAFEAWKGDAKIGNLQSTQPDLSDQRQVPPLATPTEIEPVTSRARRSPHCICAGAATVQFYGILPNDGRPLIVADRCNRGMTT